MKKNSCRGQRRHRDSWLKSVFEVNSRVFSLQWLSGLAWIGRR